jgi:hypothetical protein
MRMYYTPLLRIRVWTTLRSRALDWLGPGSQSQPMSRDDGTHQCMRACARTQMPLVRPLARSQNEGVRDSGRDDVYFARTRYVRAQARTIYAGK